MSLSVKDYIHADFILYWFNDESEALNSLRTDIVNPWFHVIYVPRPGRINERTLISNFMISLWRR